MTVEVGNRQNRSRVPFGDEKYPKRKPVNYGAADLATDERELKGRLLNANECRAQFGEEFSTKAVLFAVIPRPRLFGVEFRLGPNVEPDHLANGAKVSLHPLDNLSPRPGVAGRLAMRRKPFPQQGCLPFLQWHLVDTGRYGVPQRLNVVDLVLNREAVESRRRQRH